MATAASPWRRSQTSTAAKASSPTAGGHRVRLNSERGRIRGRRQSMTTGRHSRTRTQATRGGGAERSASGAPAARIDGTPARLAVTGAAQPRVIEAPTKPAATRASIAQRRSAGTSQTRVSAARSAPRSAPPCASRHRASPARRQPPPHAVGACALRGSARFGSGRSIDHTARDPHHGRPSRPRSPVPARRGPRVRASARR